MKYEEMRALIRELISEVLQEKKPAASRKKDVLGEPDYTDNEDEKSEMSGAVAVAGVATPLGTDASGKRTKKKKSKS